MQGPSYRIQCRSNLLWVGFFFTPFALLTSLLLLVFAMWPGVGQASASGVKTTPASEIVVALKPDKNPEAMLKEGKALAEVLSKALARPVKVITPLSGAVISEGLRNQSIDVAFVSGMDLVKEKKAKVADALLAVEIRGKTSYESYWVSLKEKPYTRLEDLRGKPIAFASRTSTSGYRIPFSDLVKRGWIKKGEAPEKFFGEKNVSFGTGYVSALERVFDGSAEAAAVSDYVLLDNKHLTPEQIARLKIVDRQGPVPTHILIVRNSLEGATQSRVRDAFLTLNQASNQTLRDQLFGGKLVNVNSSEHIRSLEEAIVNTGVE